MPHKHKRKRRDGDEQLYDLPPDTRAAALPVNIRSRKKAAASQTGGKDGKQSTNKAGDRKDSKRRKLIEDDTPREFKLLMARAEGLRAKAKADKKSKEHSISHSEESVVSIKAKPNKDDADASSSALASKSDLKLFPGERLADFNARVNQMLPLHGIKKQRLSKAKAAKLGIPTTAEKQTRIEKKIQRMQAAWRRDEARRKEKEEALEDQLEEEKALRDDYISTENSTNFHIESKKGRRKRATTKEDDPWAQLAASRGQRPALNDVAQAPPRLPVIKAETFKEGGKEVDVTNVPLAAGCLRRREDLAAERSKVIEQYRNIVNSGVSTG